MSDFGFVLHRRALLASSALTPSEREALEAAVGRLAGLSPERWPEAGARRLASEEPLFLVEVDESLRAIVRPARGGQPEVVDVVRHELLQQFLDGAARPARRA
jgi:hypothetical protein